MKALDFDRLRYVACWDLAVNRSFYLKRIRLIVGGVFAPVLLRYVERILKIFFAGERPQPEADTIGGLRELMVFLFVVLQIAALGYVFHSLSTRRGRMVELMLPASNLERFVWHVLVSTMGFCTVFTLSVLLADLLHVFLGWVVMGQTSFSSLTACLLVYGDTPLHGITTNASESVMTVAFFSTFVLGNAWKYRHNISYTLFCHLGLATCFLLLAGVGLTSLRGETFRYICLGLEVMLQAEFIAKTLAVLVSLAVLAFIWWASYRLYCRSELTTKRNP